MGAKESNPNPGSDPEHGAATAAPPAKAAPTGGHKTAPTKPARRNLPPFKVILHNDDENDMLFVVVTIRKVTGLARTDAIRKMWEAHTTGSAVLVITHRERAELYVEQFASCGVTTTAEPDV